MTLLPTSVALRPSGQPHAKPSAAPAWALTHLPVTAFAVDAVVIVGAGLVAALARHEVPFLPESGPLPAGLAPILYVVTSAWLACITAFGGYRPDALGSGVEEFKRVASASVCTAGLLCIALYLTEYRLSRGFLVLTFLLGTTVLVTGRLVLRRSLQVARGHGSMMQRAVMVGGATQIDEIADVLRRETRLGYQVVGALPRSTDDGATTPGGVPVLGYCDDVRLLPALCEDADVVFFTAGSGLTAADLRQLQWDLEQHHLQLVVAPAVTDVGAERVRVNPTAGLPLIQLGAPRWAFAARWAKRTFDVVGTLLVLLLTAPVFVVAALSVKLHDGGPVLFRHTRIGRNGTPFPCFKFRTMVVDAEARVARLRAELGADALLFKLKDDPRITRPGGWLRRFSIDELPQLFNVLRGEMSLVGPRPQVQAEVDEYDEAMRRRLRVRPGITGLWQVSGRSDLSPEDAARLDLYYVDNWSMVQDVAILARTFRAVVGSRGAY